MNMLITSALTLPLWVSQVGQKAPPLCGAIPAESSYIAKVIFKSFPFQNINSHHSSLISCNKGKYNITHKGYNIKIVYLILEIYIFYIALRLINRGRSPEVISYINPLQKSQ